MRSRRTETPAVGDNITNPIQVTDNVFGADTYGQYGVCDIDGDGKDDLFLATGSSWWYSSAGKMHWVYLKEATERLDQVGLGDFDGDGRCDVFAVNRFAKQWEISPAAAARGLRCRAPMTSPSRSSPSATSTATGSPTCFRRAPDGQWWAISPGIYDWKALQSSSFPLSELRFGHFNNDRITDVIAVQGGRWSVSWGGTTEWAPLNNALGTSLESVLIGDIDHNGVDDILRYRVISTLPPHESNCSFPSVGYGKCRGTGAATGERSRRYRGRQTFLTPCARPSPRVSRRLPGVGRADLLSVDYTRMGSVYNLTGKTFLGHSLYAY